ncbi:MAG: ribbon-helix-helix protein, CopG family [Thermoplasmata archaeon]|uniref:Ribbon-helix-helix protein, CopG family n=1 Tax=Candidatus Sysuiplasma superficiale TaxID=2823368 RepID=A0A8J8CIC4_9ARCH|nr:ribbon-helix-helix protein, CopG family [Candidatus Sysuiplasma superficiale]
MNDSIPVNLRLPEKLYDEAKKAAQNHGYSSVPDFIRQALREFLKKEVP